MSLEWVFCLKWWFFRDNLGKIYYFSPKDLTWHDLNFTYTDFLAWTLNGDIEAFYQNLFWQNWQEDVKQLDGKPHDCFTPELSEDKTTEINQRERHEVNIETHYNASFTEQDKFAQAYSVA